MGNLSSSLFATPQEKEFRRLTKKNTKVNRVSLGTPGDDHGAGQSLQKTRDPERQRRLAMTPLRFENLITEVTYDHEEGEIEVTRESLNPQSEDALGDDLIMDLVPTSVPVVAAADEEPSSPVPPAPLDANGERRILKRDSSFISAHARRRADVAVSLVQQGKQAH